MATDLKEAKSNFGEIKLLVLYGPMNVKEGHSRFGGICNVRIW